MSRKKSITIVALVLIAMAAIPLLAPEFIPFGEGTTGSSFPGSEPFRPDLQGYGTPAPGAEVNLYLMNCLGNQPGYLVLGYHRADVPRFGGIVYPAPGRLVPIWITALGGSPPVGYWSHTAIKLPASPTLSGTSIFLQAATRDSGNPYGVTLSNGLEMRIE